MDDACIHSEVTHDEEGDSIKGWNIQVHLPPLLDPFHCDGWFLRHSQFFRDEIGCACAEVVEGYLVFDELWECVVDSAIASDDDEPIGFPDFI